MVSSQAVSFAFVQDGYGHVMEEPTILSFKVYGAFETRPEIGCHSHGSQDKWSL